MKKAFITGISGQDGSYLADLLLNKGYLVYGIRRRTSLFNSARIDHLYEEAQNPGRHLMLLYADLSDSSSLFRWVDHIKPDEVYNLGAQSHVGVSFDIPEYTGDVVAMGTIRLLEAVRRTHLKAKFYQASSSEMFGKAAESPQNESTPFYPRSPYGVAKVYAYWATKNYREAYGLFACNGVLFNHESPRRGRTFVTRKITRAVARIKLGLQEVLYLGNLNASRDWGHAKDYVYAMWLMMQQEKPDDFVIASGETHTVREFVEKAFPLVDIAIRWQGKGVDEVGIDKKSGKVVVRIDPLYFRPSEVDCLLGDPSKAKKVLNWRPEYSFDDLVKEMVAFDLKNESKANGYANY